MKRNLDPTPSANIANDEFLQARATVATQLLSDGDGVGAATALTAATDVWIRALWQEAGGFEASLSALGGFGRCELCLGSDVDLVIEVAEGVDDSAELLECVERFIAWARVTRVKVAHSVRTPAQTIEAFGEDIRTAVSYLDARTLAGEPEIGAAQARTELRGADLGVDFVRTLLDGTRARLERFGQTIYLLEPDLKSGKGALRDVHVVSWAGMVRGDFQALLTANDACGWTAADARELRAGQVWLLGVRGLLHAIHGRKHDRLHFPDQEKIAAVLVDPDASPAVAAEALMRRHYQVTRGIAKATERALRRWAPAPRTIECRIDERFRVDGAQLVLDGDAPPVPEEVLEGLRLASEYDVLLEPVSEERFETAVAGWTEQTRTNRALGAVFCGLLTDLAITPRTSTRLLELGVLPALIPEFEPVVCHVQHDVYHVYTTDVHLLRCLEFARSLAQPDSAVTKRWPDFAEIVARIEDPQVFLLAALLHDVGKNRGGGHSERGAAMVLDIGPRLGLNRDRTDLLSFLVREHLVLSHVARRHDLSDRRLVRDLAARIRTEEALNQLTALTFCDMSTVGRNPITDWNAALLLQLHERLETTIRHGVEEAWRHIARDVDLVRGWLATHIPDGRTYVDAFIRDLPAAYLIEASTESLARAFEAWRAGVEGETVVMATPDAERGSTEVIVSAPDNRGVLAQITGAISSLGLNILDARITTTSSGRVLDIFQVAQHGGASHVLERAEQAAVTDDARLRRLKERLLAVVQGERTADEFLRQRQAEQKLSPRTTPEVETLVEEIVDLSDDYTVVQVKAPDRIGLLYDIARTLSGCEVNICLSKIDCVGTQVIDTFYLETLDHRQLEPDQVATVIDELRAAVRPEVSSPA